MAAEGDLADRLLQPVMVRAMEAVPGAVGVGVSLYEECRGRSVAGVGQAPVLDALQWRSGEGPVVQAATSTSRVTSRDLGADERWPGLREASTRSVDALGAVAQPSVWQNRVLVFSLYLDGPPPDWVLELVERHHDPTVLALVLGSTHDTARAEQLRVMLRSRRVLEQAKGVVMALQRCSPEAAFDVLRRVSQQHNVKARHVAGALVEYVTGAPVERDAEEKADPSTPDGQYQRLAAHVWYALQNGQLAEPEADAGPAAASQPTA